MQWQLNFKALNSEPAVSSEHEPCTSVTYTSDPVRQTEGFVQNVATDITELGDNRLDQCESVY